MFFLDERTTTLIIVCIAMGSFVVILLMITCGVCAFTRFRGKHLFAVKQTVKSKL